ncbi:MAG: hypothetical protein WBP64_07245 [Nitrososphaeraceae archaeon]
MNLKSVTPGTTRAKTSVLEIEIVERKINLATEGFTRKFCEGPLKDRTRLSKENTLTISENIIVMKREINPRLSHIRTTLEGIVYLICWRLKL